MIVQIKHKVTRQLSADWSLSTLTNRQICVIYSPLLYETTLLNTRKAIT